MPSNGVQPGGQGIPAFPNTDAFDLGADAEELARYAAYRGNTLRGTSAQRDAFAYAVEGLFWSNTTDDTLDRFDGTSWVSIFALPLGTVNPTLASGWATPSSNLISRRSGIAFLQFNGARSADSAVDSVVVSVPAGFRSGRNEYFQAWGNLGAAPAIQCFYDAGAHQIKMRQTILSGQAIALSASWPISS